MLLLPIQCIESSACTRDLFQVIYDNQTMRERERERVCVCVCVCVCVKECVCVCVGILPFILASGFEGATVWRCHHTPPKSKCA